MQVLDIEEVNQVSGGNWISVIAGGVAGNYATQAITAAYNWGMTPGSSAGWGPAMQMPYNWG